jgi:signal transduction histidine kinase
MNLAENAFNYNRPDGCVRISLIRQADAYLLCVEDNGIGISPEEQERIFEPFYRIDASRQTTTGGTGLGLAIVKKVVDDHQASIGVQSTIGKGTQFSIHIAKSHLEQTS